MKKIVNKIYNKFGIKTSRTENITNHVLLSFFYKGGSIIANFIMVPLTINYLDTENYGIWLTLSSFISWFSFFDIGLGNGLRNKFAEAKAKGDITSVRGYISSAYFTIGAVSFSLILLFIGLNFFIDWTKVFNTSPALQRDLSLLMPIVFAFFCLQLVVKLITTIYTADQQHSIQVKVTFFTNIITLGLIWLMIKTSESSLLLFGIIFSIFPVIVLLLLNLLGFSNRYSLFKPSFRFWKKKYLKEIFGLGVLFFVIQISGIVLFTTDNFIISKLFSPQEVVTYNIAYKYMSISSIIFSIIASPYWSSITDAYNKNDFNWIKNAMRTFQNLSIIFILMIVIMVFISTYFYQVWIGSKLIIDNTLTILMGIFFAASIYVTPYTIFLNGTGKVQIQAIQSVVVSIINIPLSIFLSNYNVLGVNGVILATIICFIPSLVLSQLQYHKILKKTATGIWNK